MDHAWPTKTFNLDHGQYLCPLQRGCPNFVTIYVKGCVNLCTAFRARVRSCFQRVISSGTCDLVPLETTSITTIGNTIKIFSPDFGIENTTYPNDILCQYALPSCPSEGSLMHISWFSGLFVLEPPGINGPFTICSDFLRFFNLPLDLAALGLELDSFGVLCDQQNTFFEQFSGPPLLVSEVASISSERISVHGWGGGPSGNKF